MGTKGTSPAKTDKALPKLIDTEVTKAAGRKLSGPPSPSQSSLPERQIQELTKDQARVSAIEEIKKLTQPATQSPSLEPGKIHSVEIDKLLDIGAQLYALEDEAKDVYISHAKKWLDALNSLESMEPQGALLEEPEIKDLLQIKLEAEEADRILQGKFTALVSKIQGNEKGAELERLSSEIRENRNDLKQIDGLLRNKVLEHGQLALQEFREFRSRINR